MGHDTAKSPAIDIRRLRPGVRTGFALVGLLAAFGLVAAACGNGTQTPGAASAETTTTIVAPSGSSGSVSSSETRQSEELQLAQCMRSHGVPDFPDPSANGNQLQNIANSGVDTRSPAYQSALSACHKYSPAGNLTPAQSAADNAKGLEISQCMRSHGVPNFPDPIIGPTGGQAINLSGTGIDQNSPTYQAADEACQKLFPGGK
ncbi:MAG TPA: hypothetical protein VHT30_05315 [Acidimicrobiales bacterium]|jgi:hypothetical protein|nr:hypothetical protein [Acidimicrobiales bacterium]